MKDMNPTELDTNEWIDPTIKRLGKEKARLTRGGPGDKSTPGNVDTSEWWQDVSKRTKENEELYGSIKPKEISKALEDISKIEIITTSKLHILSKLNSAWWF